MASERRSGQVKGLLEHCLEASKRRDYATALTFVELALKARETDRSISLINILDHRVAVYLRMDRLDQALKDAKAMIRLDPEDARGYIRSGITERRKNNKLGAIRFFKHGLKKVPSSDANHALLAKEMEETAEQMRIEIVHSQARDPFNVLPFEIIEMILSLLSYRSNIHLLRVSRSWNNIVSSSRPLVDTLAFPAPTRSITTRMLNVALKRCRRLKTAMMPPLLPDVAGYFCQVLAQRGRFPALQYFHWKGVPNYADWLPVCQYDLRVIFIDSEITPISVESIVTVLRKCRSLQMATFRYVSGRHDGPVSLHSDSLTALKFHCMGSRLDSGLKTAAISFECPRLRVLSLLHVPTGVLDLSHMTELRDLKVFGTRIHRISLPTSLRQLLLAECCFHGQLFDPGELTPRFNELVELQILDCGGPIKFLFDCIQKTISGKLSKFVITVNEEVAPDLITIMSMPWFQTVKSLQLCDTDFISPHGFQHIKKCLALEELYIERAGSLGTFVSDLIREAVHLRRVTLEECPNVARDIIPWAKERGVEVKISQARTPTASGRRIVEIH
ncbi:hypothetical protein AYL99_00062 [Fonsecaea erecta]|uniref:F-box domain-containing protein n=1 Tax=Fonsecaea erecta TaxID=1367422 RepID=A0A178ZW97_9EURO|nr:hypothetical protein AYL99_00062 [Fonsecaea erecta]OAP64090.1 hypothetical protein AYL99_00062 [Fonsecaea erecta]